MPARPDPDLTLRLAKETAEVYSTAVDDLLAIVARRLAGGIDRPGWAEAKLLQLARLRNEGQARVDRIERDGPAAATRAVRDAWSAGEASAIRELRAVGSLVPGTSSAAVDALVRETVTGLQGSHLRILRSVDDIYRQVVAEASGVVTGSQSRRQVAQRILNRLADRGVTGFTDRAGRGWSLETYAEMSARTASGRAMVQGTLDRYQASGRDLVIISDAPQECSACRPWEGMVMSISGTTPGYPALASATGLWHANCRHTAHLYVEGVTRRMTHTADPEGDRARQEQRRLERGVRHWRRRAAVALDDDTRRYAERHAREWQGRLRAHVDEAGLIRRRERERLGVR